jgi:hypothetical protein
LRRALVASVAAAALVFTGSALASYVPHLAVSQVVAKTTIHITIAKADDATARLVIYSPATATATLNQAVGTQIGTVTAQVNAKAISPDAILPLTGVVQVADSTNAALAMAAQQCTGTTTHAATWALVLTAAGQTLTVPAWIDATSGAEAAFGAGKITVCLPSPDVPQAQGGAQFGAKLLDVDFNVSGIFAASSVPISTWPGIFTPYVAGTATVNAAGTVLALGISAKPVVAFSAKAGKNRRASFSGRVSAGGVPAAGVSVVVLSGSRKLATTKTSASGTFSASAKLKRGTYSLRARASAGDTDVTSQGCAAAPSGPGVPPCVSATAAGATTFSATVRLTVK